MRLEELNLDGYKKIKTEKWGPPYALQLWLENNDFDVLGYGMYSAVYGSKTENFVVKVNKGTVMDENFIAYAEYCHKNKNNPYLPKMGKLKDWHNYYIVFIEKLAPIDFSLKEICLKWFKMNSQFLVIQILEQNPKNVEDIHRLLTDALIDHMETKYDSLIKMGMTVEETRDYMFSVMKKEMPHFDDLVEIINECIKISNDCGFEARDFDIHSGNIMKRGNQLVLTDPVT